MSKQPLWQLLRVPSVVIECGHLTGMYLKNGKYAAATVFYLPKILLQRLAVTLIMKIGVKLKLNNLEQFLRRYHHEQRKIHLQTLPKVKEVNKIYTQTYDSWY